MSFALVHFLAFFVWLAAASVGPGLFFVRHLRWKPVETLCASVAASLFLIYLASLAIYAFDFPVAASHRILAGACFALTLATTPDLLRLVSRVHVRRVLGGFAILWGWVLLQAAQIRHFSGGFWYGDWIEHYKRCLYFLEHWDVNYKFLNMYYITARPPMMNLICVHFMALFGRDFVVYQITAGFLNLLPALGCFLLATTGVRQKWGRGGTMAAAVLLLSASPLFMESVAFPWTKSFTAFPCLLAVWFYIRGWQTGDRTRTIAAFALAAMACLIHYYALAWGAGLAIHYALAVWGRRKHPFREVGAIVAVVIIVTAPWFAWAIYEFGVKATFSSNTTAWAVNELTGSEQIRTVSFNLFGTVVPFFVREVPYGQFAQTSWAGRVRDLVFCLYETNAIFVWGICGGAALLAALRGNRRPANVRRFWWILLVCSSVLGVVSIPTAEDWGTIDLWGLPLLLLGLCALAAGLGNMSVVWRRVVVCGCAVDFVAGILLQVHLEHRVDASELSRFAQKNLLAKNVLGYRYIGDSFGGGPGLEILLCVVMGAMLLAFIRPGLLRRGRPVRAELHEV
jgi:hypothetical protein